MRSDSSPRESEMIVSIGGERYLIASAEQASQVGGGARQWHARYIPAQPADPTVEKVVSLQDFSEGAGFTFEGLPGTYERADGWDCSSPGKPATWPRRAKGATFTTVDYPGWQVQHGGYLYVMRGNLCCKYALDDTKGATWPIIEAHYFGASNVVAGRPAIFGGKLYVPLRAGAGGALAVFAELDTVSTTSPETQTVAISGTPTSGTYTLTFNGRTTAAIAFNAAAAAVQSALRLLPGLEQVTVTDTGTIPNFTHTVVMTGVDGASGATSPPQMTSTDSMSGGTHAIAHATTVAGVADQWDAGPATREMSCFVVWGNLLRGANGNRVYSCAGDPTSSGNWLPAAGSGYEVGDSTITITDLWTYLQDLAVLTDRGLFTFDESFNATNQLPDLAAIGDRGNGVGTTYSNGYLLIPHKSALFRWRPGAYQEVGPAQEGGQDGSLSRGVGRVASVTPFGKYAFYAANDALNQHATLGSLQPSRGGRGPLVPHIHQSESPAYYEHVLVISPQNEPATARAPVTWSDDNAVGTITWGNPSNAGASDDAYATAAVGTSHYLKGLNPGPNVPTNATITGVKIDIERKADV